jgi:hypothetical protein
MGYEYLSNNWNLRQLMSLSEDRVILKLTDDELEDLIKKWIANEASSYVDFDRNSGAGDRGIDDVGFLTNQRYEGAWHNYQCKQLGRPLGELEFFSEIGKVLYYASKEEFTLPERYIFVAPKGVVRSVRKWVGMPSKLKIEIEENWSTRCGSKIIAKTNIAMTSELSSYINSFDFSKIETWNVQKLLEKPNLRKVLHEHVDIDPGMAPCGNVPEAVVAVERPYVNQLIEIYNEHYGTTFTDELDVFGHPDCGPHLQDQRRRYYDADAFHRHFRDNLLPELLDRFDQDIYDGVIDEYRSTSGYERVTSVMKLAGMLQVSGIFEKHKCAPVSVKQGTCHHFANKGDLAWKK